MNKYTIDHIDIEFQVLTHTNNLTFIELGYSYTIRI